MLRAALLALAIVPLIAAAADPLPRVAPEEVGFATEGLARIDRFFEREIAGQRVPGAVVAIARDGKLVYYKAFGQLDKASGVAMPLDAIFQLASMTKVMAVAGALTLTEEGRLPLHSRLDEYFPEFAKKTVGLPVADAKQEVAGPIYIQDLMRHTSGITYGARGDTPLHKLYPPSSAGAAAQYTGEQLIAKLAPLPLLYQPGTVWDYGLSTDVLGLVMEKVTGQRLGPFLKARVWDVVGMPDTTFEVPAERRKRIARPLRVDPLTGRDQRIASLEQAPKFHCAGGCAYGTVGDYLRFAQMLINGGTIDGKRVLGPKTVAFMTSDHLGTTIRNQVAGIEGHREGYGFGLGVAVRVHDGIASVPGSPGDFTWNGANGSAFWGDPKERLVVVYGTAAPGEIRKYYREQMADLVYGAMK